MTREEWEAVMHEDRKKARLMACGPVVAFFVCLAFAGLTIYFLSGLLGWAEHALTHILH